MLNYDALLDDWAGEPASEHAYLEAEHAARSGHRPGDPPTLGPRDPVPGCSCVECRLRHLVRAGFLGPGTADLVRSNVLPALASRIPAERPAVAERLRHEWAEAALIVLPPVAMLVELAARMPGARAEPRPVRDDRDSLPIEEARRAKILGVCEELGIELKRAGKSYRGDCPFHESSSGTSFTVDPSKGLFHCFGCGAGGDVIDLVRRVRDVSFPEAVRELAS